MAGASACYIRSPAALPLLAYAGPCFVCAQTQAASAPREKADAEALRKYAGRYELEVGLIPVSTLDVTLEGGEL